MNRGRKLAAGLIACVAAAAAGAGSAPAAEHAHNAAAAATQAISPAASLRPLFMWSLPGLDCERS